MPRSETLRKRVIRDAARAVHEKWCGSPPSCGCSDPCVEAQVNPDEIAIVVDVALRAAHQERDADARRLDAIQRALTNLDLYADGIAIAAYIVSATGELGYCIGHLDGDTAHFSDDADGPTLRAALDAAMAPDTQTEAARGD